MTAQSRWVASQGCDRSHLGLQLAACPWSDRFPPIRRWALGRCCCLAKVEAWPWAQIFDLRHAREVLQGDLTPSGEGANMSSNHRYFLAAVVGLLASILPAFGQDFPDGPGKQVVTAVCGGCHDINRLRRMMQNVDTPRARGSVGYRCRLSHQELSRATTTRRQRRRWPCRGRDQAMAGSNSGFATT